MDNTKLIELLSKPKWWIMYRANDPKERELTTLDDKDINAIVNDVNLKRVTAPTIETNGDTVVVEYPKSNGCKLESHNEGVYIGAKLMLEGFGLAYAEVKDSEGRFFVKSPTTLHEAWLTEQEIYDQIMH